MANVTRTPTHIETTTGGKYSPFQNLTKIKDKKTNTYSETTTINGKTKTPNRPGTILCNKFQSKIPTGSTIKKISVHYAHSKTGDLNIPAPTITLMNGDKPLKYQKTGKSVTGTGQAPTNSVKTHTKSYKSEWDYTTINSADFGVRINYPTNANGKSGTVRLHYVYLVITYTAPDYSVKIEQPGTSASISSDIPKNTGYNGDPFIIGVTLSNKTKTKYIPTLTVTAPAGLSLDHTTGDGTVTKIQNGVWTWKPKKLKGIKTVTCLFYFNVNVTFPSGTTDYPITFTAAESLLRRNTSFTGHIIPKPPETDTIDDGSTDYDDLPEKDEAEIVDYIIPDNIIQIKRETLDPVEYHTCTVTIPLTTEQKNLINARSDNRLRLYLYNSRKGNKTILTNTTVGVSCHPSFHGSVSSSATSVTFELWIDSRAAFGQYYIKAAIYASNEDILGGAE